MSDEVEQTEVKSALLLEATVAARRAEAAKDNVPFIAGDCECCEEPSERLVRCVHPKDGDVWACARCRDKLKLKVKRAP